MRKEQYNKYLQETPESKAFHELDTIYSSKIDDYGAFVLEYAVITCCVRNLLKGVSAEFLERATEQLSMEEYD